MPFQRYQGSAIVVRLVQIPIPLLLELEANLLDQNVNELEFERSRMWMKRPFDDFLIAA